MNINLKERELSKKFKNYKENLTNSVEEYKYKTNLPKPDLYNFYF